MQRSSYITVYNSSTSTCNNSDGNQDNSVLYSVLTLLKIAEGTTTSGMAANRARVIIQFLYSPTAIAATKVAIHWIKIARLLPIPSWIFSKSLWENISVIMSLRMCIIHSSSLYQEQRTQSIYRLCNRQ